MLHCLHLTNVGPAPQMKLELAPRLNLLTGDNGLGKSFLLDCIGLRRVAALAYMLMWSWERNVSYADSQGLDRAQNVILILDEIEAHLHPRWQRSILHSVIHVMENLHAKANVQVIASTHSRPGLH